MSLDIELNKILWLIRENKKFLEYFSQIKEIESDLFSFMANKECSCRKNIEKFIEENIPLINKLISHWKEKVTDWEIIIEEGIKNESKESKDLKERIKKTIHKPTIEEKHIMGKNKDGISRNLQGVMVEMGAVAQNYKEMIEFGEKNKWRYNGVCVVNSVTKKGKKPYLIYRNFFY